MLRDMPSMNKQYSILKSLILFSYLFMGCQELPTTQFQMRGLTLDVDTVKRHVLFSENGDTGQSWFMRIDSYTETFTVVKWNSNGSQVEKQFDKNFRLIRIDWVDSEGSYASTEYIKEIGKYAFECSPDFRLDSALMYQSMVVPEMDRGRYMIAITNDFFPIQTVFPSVNSKYDLRYDIPNNMVYVEMDSTFTGKSVQLSYSAFVHNDLIQFESPITVEWPNK